MPYFECYLFGGTRRMPACAQIECGDEAAALSICRELLAGKKRYVAFELWQFRRLIRREERSAARPVPLTGPRLTRRGRIPRLVH